MSTDRNEALRLADWHAEQAHGWRNAASLSAADKAEPVRSSLLAKAAFHDKSAALLRQQAGRISDLEKEIADLHTTMFAAAVEIHEHWDAHCDAEGYGPANLMHRLERGIASQYGYDAKTLQRIEAERDQLRAEVERLTPNAERWEYALNSEEFAVCEWGTVFGEPCWVPISEESAIDHARTTHKDEG